MPDHSYVSQLQDTDMEIQGILTAINGCTMDQHYRCILRGTNGGAGIFVVYAYPSIIDLRSGHLGRHKGQASNTELDI